MQMFLRGKPTTPYYHNRDRVDCSTGVARQPLGNSPGNSVIEMSLSSAFLAGCDTGRQQVKDSWEHLHLEDTIPPAGVWWHWRKSPRPVTSCCRENFIRLLVHGLWVLLDSPCGQILWVILLSLTTKPKTKSTAALQVDGCHFNEGSRSCPWAPVDEAYTR